MILALLSSILGRKRATKLSKLSTNVPIGHAQLQNIAPSKIIITATTPRAIMVGISRSRLTFVVMSACNPPSGSTIHMPVSTWHHPFIHMLQGDSTMGM